MIVLVFGGRTFNDERYMTHVFSWFMSTVGPISQVIEGDARGADRLSERVAYSFAIPVRKFRADWDKYGKGAGHIRNQQMLDEGRPQAAMGFAGGAGTRDMANRIIKAGILLIDAGCLTTTNNL